jgi:hypothetical protein
MTEEMPPRIVHLPGGLRAVDDRSGNCSIQLNHKTVLGSFPTAKYPQLYSELSSLCLPTLGCEFVNAGSYKGLYPPDWEVASPSGGFRILEERNQWNNVRHAKNDAHELEIADLAARTSTYLQLLSIRLLQLSEAYNKMLNCWAGDQNRETGHLIGNAYMTYIDAAIHGFVADAASFRDLIAESIWRLVLRQQESVTTLASFIKKANNMTNPLAVSVCNDSKTGAWLHAFTQLRNNIIHVAPMGRGSSKHACIVRGVTFGSGQIPMLHYPLLEPDETLHQSSRLDLRTDESAKVGLKEYRDFCVRSIDGLDYAWRTTSKLIELQSEVRRLAGLSAEFPHFTDEDIVGEVVWRPLG